MPSFRALLLSPGWTLLLQERVQDRSFYFANCVSAAARRNTQAHDSGHRDGFAGEWLTAYHFLLQPKHMYFTTALLQAYNCRKEKGKRNERGPSSAEIVIFYWGTSSILFTDQSSLQSHHKVSLPFCSG
jgi:hypothetical protein